MEDESVWGPRIDRPEGGWPDGKCPIPGVKANEYQIAHETYGCHRPLDLDAAYWKWTGITAYRVRADLHRVQPAEPDVVERIDAALASAEKCSTTMAAAWHDIKHLRDAFAAPAHRVQPASMSTSDVVERMAEALRKMLNYCENTEAELGITLSCADAGRAALAAHEASKQGAGR